MKFLPSQLAYLMEDGESKQNLSALARFVGIFVASLAAFSVVFHVIMIYEGQQHSWITGLYWTLTVMSTLGFGDITFTSDLGRLFSIFVLIYGVVMLLIVAPFTFIRFFYAPWLEAQIRQRAPRGLEEKLTDHVVICGHDGIALGLIERLAEYDISYVLIEPNVTDAAALHVDELSVVTGRRDVKETYEAVCVADARLVVVNLSDVENTNIILTIREISADVPIVAFAEAIDSVDVLELAGANHVIPLKQRLGEQLAARVTAGTQTVHRIGRFEDLVIAEFPIHGTRLVGRTISDTNLRKVTGLNIVAVWERGRLLPAGPGTMLNEHSIPIVVGTEEQLTDLDAIFVIYHATDVPVLVIGGGVVGRSVCHALRERGASVTLLDQDERIRGDLLKIANHVVIGDAANLETVKAAGVEEAPSIVLTTNDDATNIFLAVYCRKLTAAAHIVSRMTHDWNLEAIHRAGADFALSRASLAIQTLISLILDRPLIVIGEGVELMTEPVPANLVGVELSASGIGADTGLNVIGIRVAGQFVANPAATTELVADGELLMMGTREQHRLFLELHPRT